MAESNIDYLEEHERSAYTLDNRFRERDKRADEQKNKYCSVDYPKTKTAIAYQAMDFQDDVQAKRCVCPADITLQLHSQRIKRDGNNKLFFQVKSSVCLQCDHKSACMRNPNRADTRTGHGQQVSLIVTYRKIKSPCARWMLQLAGREHAKEVYPHRMSVLELVFGNLEANKGLGRFILLSQEKVNAQWLLFFGVRNIEKRQFRKKLQGSPEVA